MLATTVPFETFFCSSRHRDLRYQRSDAGSQYEIRVAALDTTNDGHMNYDTLVSSTPSAHPRGTVPLAEDRPGLCKIGGESAPFFFEGSRAVVGAAYFASTMSADLAQVKFVRYGANFIPRNAPVIADVNDTNNNVGFWMPQPDFRIPERIIAGLHRLHRSPSWKTLFEDR